MKYNEINMEGFLAKYSSKNVVYCSNPGNAGDAIIAYGTFRLFEKLNIQPKIISHTEKVVDQTIFYAGGGNLVEDKYKNAFHFIKNNIVQNREIVLLPHTVYGYDELLLSAKNLTIICREKVSYDYLSMIGFPEEKLFLAKDMAFLLSDVEFEQYATKAEGIANCLRSDFESLKLIDIPENNLDISLAWNGEHWHRPEFAKNVTHSLACYLSGFSIVKTDRLHIAILAGLMGKKVIMYSNNYYKNKAVYDYSINGKYNNISFIELETLPVSLNTQHENSKFVERIQQLELKIKENDKCFADQIIQVEIENKAKAKYIRELEEEKKKLDGVFQSKSWKITKPLRFVMSFLRRD